MKFLRPLITAVVSVRRLNVETRRRSDARRLPEWSHRMARKQAALARSR